MSLSDKYVCEGQMSITDWLNLDTWCGKTSPEPLAVTKEKTSEQCLKKLRELRIKPPLYLDLRRGGGQQAEPSWETGGALLGEYMMRSFGESPSVENVSRLSQILEERPHPKYSLSAKACQGILRRAEKRGKQLPEQLRIALERQSVSKSAEENLGGAKEYLSNESEPEHCQHSITNPSSKCLNSWDVQSDEAGKEVAEVAGENIGNTSMLDEWVAAVNASAKHQQDLIQHDQGIARNANGSQRMPDKDNFNAVITTSHGGFMCNADESGIAHTLQATDYKDPQIVTYGIDQQGGKGGANYTENVAPTLAADSHGTPHGVCYGLDRASFNQGQNALYDFSVQEELAQTIVAKGPGGVLTQQVLCVREITKE